MADEILVYDNDSTDSDNWATAVTLQRIVPRNPSVELIWIYEPRHANFECFMTPEQTSACLELIRTYFSSRNPMKTLLRGDLQLSDLDKLEGVTEKELELLKLAVKPASGPREDSIKHARLMVLDYATVLRHRSDGPIKIFVDRDALDNLESPINPYIHHHDELVARTEPELTRHQAIMDLPPSERANGVRRWSDDVISTLETEAQEHGDMICDLDIDKLCETLKAAKKVRYFVGASFSRLARLIRKGAGGNIECYAQAGTFDTTLNLIDCPYNIALNPDDADFVFSNSQNLASLMLIPTDTTKRVKYSLVGLHALSSSIVRRCLAFNCRVEALELAAGSVSADEFLHDRFCLPDLTAVLLAFTESFPSSTLEFARVVDKRGQLVQEHVNSGIQVFKLAQDILVEDLGKLLE